jgi:hypothetical protein
MATTYKQKCLKINSRLKLDKYNGMYYIITGNKHASTTYSNAHPTPASAWADCYESLTKEAKETEVEKELYWRQWTLNGKISSVEIHDEPKGHSIVARILGKKSERLHLAQRITRATNILSKLEKYTASTPYKVNAKQDAVLEYINELLK